MKFNLTSGLILVAVVLVTLKFREQLLSAVGSLPVIGGLVK